MKYLCFFILVLTGWSSWGTECTREEFEELKWDVQNYQEFDREYQASIHRMLYNCEKIYGAEDPEDPLYNLREAVDRGSISDQFTLAKYYLTRNRDQAIEEFEKTLKKINAVFANYPNTFLMASGEIHFKIYPRTLLYLMHLYSIKYLEEGYIYYAAKSPTHYGDPTEAIERDQAHRDILNRLEYHIESCLADHEGQHIPERVAKQWGQYETISGNLAAYGAFYLKLKGGLCPHYEELLVEIRKREARMHDIARHCAPPSEQATDDRPPCANIKMETEEFARFFTEKWEPKKHTI